MVVNPVAQLSPFFITYAFVSIPKTIKHRNMQAVAAPEKLIQETICLWIKSD